MKLEVVEIKDNEDGSAILVVDYDKRFLDLVKEKLQNNSPSEQDISDYIIKLIEDGIKEAKEGKST